MSSAGWQLAKVPLCLLIGCSALFGYILADNVLSMRTLQVSAGVVLLAMGAATLNSLQEAVVDGTMARTAGRPLPQGKLPRRQALLQAWFFILGGLLPLAALAQTFLPLFLGVMALLLYNWVYTPLKQKNVLAIVPGAMCGALPPLIGWTAADGDLLSYGAMLLAVLLVLWQVPHFLLILLRHQRDYLQARQPSFLKLFSERGMRRLSCVWISALALVMLIFTVVPVQLTVFVRCMLAVNAIALIVIAIWQLLLTRSADYKLLFVNLNISLLTHMLIFTIGRMV